MVDLLVTCACHQGSDIADMCCISVLMIVRFTMVPEHCSGLVACMVAAVQASHDLAASMDGDLVFFTVSQSRGEQRKVVLPPHIDHSRTKVEIIFYEVCSRDGLRSCVLKSTEMASEFDLMQLASPARLASIAAWCKVSRTTRPCMSGAVMKQMRDTSML